MSRTSNVGFVYRQYTKDGIFMADYKSSREAAEAAGTSSGAVVRAAHGERKTGGGFIWKKVKEETPQDNIEIDPRRRLLPAERTVPAGLPKGRGRLGICSPGQKRGSGQSGCPGMPRQPAGPLCEIKGPGTGGFVSGRKQRPHIPGRRPDDGRTACAAAND